MRLPKCLGRRAYEPPKELDEVGRLVEAEKLADRDRRRGGVHEEALGFEGDAPVHLLLGRMAQHVLAGARQSARRHPHAAASSATDGRAWTRSSSARRRRRISVACAVGADG